jgi:pilus assembly protein CpaB
MSRITKTIAIVLVVLAVLMAGLAWKMGTQSRSPRVVVSEKTAPKAKAYTAVAAAKKLEKGKAILAADLKTIDMPQQVPGSYPKIDEVVGKVPMFDIAAESVVMEGSMVNGLALKLKDGERALAIPVDEVVSVGNKLEAGDYVDVFVALKESTAADKGQARLLSSRRQVLAYGGNVVGVNSNKNADSRQQSSARTAVLSVPMDQVNAFLLATQNGKLMLALRSPADTAVADGKLFIQPDRVLRERSGLSADEKLALNSADNQAYSGVDLSSWATGKAKGHVAPAPQKTAAAPSSRTVEVIKGTQRENVAF